MERLRRRGITFAVDDFGTGYSSLAYLKRLPVDTIKIDRSFIRDIMADAADGAIVDGIITMSDRLGFDVVAEGVETGEQLALLRARGCKRFKGFYRGQPAPFETTFGRTASGPRAGQCAPGSGG